MNRSVHDQMVGSLVTHLSNNGFVNIQADFFGYNQPEAIWWENNPNAKYIPDAVAEQNGVLHIFEVETEDSITSKHTEEQWKLFSAHARNNNGKFVAVVPSSAKADAEQQINNLNITGEVWDVAI